MRYRRRQRLLTANRFALLSVVLGAIAFVVVVFVLLIVLTGCVGSRGAPPVTPPANASPVFMTEGAPVPWTEVELARVASPDRLGVPPPHPRRRPSTSAAVILPIDPQGRPYPIAWTFDGESVPPRTPDHQYPWKLCLDWVDHADDNQMSCSGESGAGPAITLQVLIPGRTFGRPFMLAGIQRRYRANLYENGTWLFGWSGLVVQEVVGRGKE